MKSSLLLSGFVAALLIAEAPAAQKELRVGFTMAVGKTSEYSEKDLLIATQVLLRNVVPNLPVKCIAFQGTSELTEKALKGELDLIELPPVDYFLLKPEDKARFEPACITSSSLSRLDQFVLLGPPGTTLEKLAGKRLFRHLGNDRGTLGIWLDKVLGRPAGQHFGSVQEATRAEKVILETFFGKADACAVRAEDYHLMAELNPQVTQRLVPLATSPGIPVGLMVFRRDIDPELRRLVRENIPIYHQNPKIVQALTMLRVSRLVFVEDSDFAGIATLLAQSSPPTQALP